MYNGLLRFNKHILNELAEGLKHLPNLDGVSKGVTKLIVIILLLNLILDLVLILFLIKLELIKTLTTMR
jgi:hypothetical protein